PREELINGVRVVRLPYVARVSRTVVMPSLPGTVARLIAEHDIVHIHTPMPELALVTATARALGKPSIVTHQGDVVMPAGLLNQRIPGAWAPPAPPATLLPGRAAWQPADWGPPRAPGAPRARRRAAFPPPVELPEPQPDNVAAWRRELGLEGKKLVGFAG